MTIAYIGIGSNLGHKSARCREAIEHIDRTPGCRVKTKSSLYRTDPVGVQGQDWYVNGVIEVETRLSPDDLLKALLTIESNMGRKRKKKWEARIIDLDLLLYGDEVLEKRDLTVPHPLMHERRFVLIPMAQIAPQRVHPFMGKTMKELLEDFAEEGQAVHPLEGE